MELKLNKIQQSKIYQDTLYTIEEGIYIDSTYQALVEKIKKYALDTGFDLVNIEPVKFTVRQYFDTILQQEQYNIPFSKNMEDIAVD